MKVAEHILQVYIKVRSTIVTLFKKGLGKNQRCKKIWPWWEVKADLIQKINSNVKQSKRKLKYVSPVGW